MKSTTEKLLPAAGVISDICTALGYTRPHVAKLMRTNAKAIGATKAGRGRWMLTRAGSKELKRIVMSESGRRYKSGETGPNRASTNADA
jgi:hypothetical protein